MSDHRHEPAFPAPHFDLADGEHGLTKREYFALEILKAQCSDLLTSGLMRSADLQFYSERACKIADALLSALEPTK